MNDKLKEELLTAVAIALGALFFATVITLIVARYYRQIKAFCARCCQTEDGEPVNTPRSATEKNANVPYNKMIEDVKRSSTYSGRFPPMFLSSKDNPFTIPGSFFAQAIQPEIKFDSLSDESIKFNRESSVSGSPSGTPTMHRRLTLSTVSLPANFSPKAARRISRSQQESPIYSSEEDDNAATHGNKKLGVSVEDLMFLNIRPELYDISRRKTVGKGNLGKISISLQYEDKSRKKLDLFIQKITKLQFARPDIIGIYASIVLLPEREGIFTTNQHTVTASPIFEEKFIFSSKPMNRDFESKTVLILVHYTDRASKDVIYGEARMPLLSREIYSQVPTDVTLNIKAASMQVCSSYLSALPRLITRVPLFANSNNSSKNNINNPRAVCSVCSTSSVQHTP